MCSPPGANQRRCRGLTFVDSLSPSVSTQKKYPSLHSPSIRPSIHQRICLPPSSRLSPSPSLIWDYPAPRSATSPFNLPLFLVASFLFSLSLTLQPSLHPSFSPHPSRCSAAAATAAALWSSGTMIRTEENWLWDGDKLRTGSSLFFVRGGGLGWVGGCSADWTKKKTGCKTEGEKNKAPPREAQDVSGSAEREKRFSGRRESKRQCRIIYLFIYLRNMKLNKTCSFTPSPPSVNSVS